VCRIPEREHRKITADNLLSLSVKPNSLITLRRVDGFFKEAIKLRVLVAAAVAPRALLCGNFCREENVSKENRVLIAANPAQCRHLKIAKLQFIQQRIGLHRLNLYGDADLL